MVRKVLLVLSLIISFSAIAVVWFTNPPFGVRHDQPSPKVTTLDQSGLTPIDSQIVLNDAVAIHDSEPGLRVELDYNEFSAVLVRLAYLESYKASLNKFNGVKR